MLLSRFFGGEPECDFDDEEALTGTSFEHELECDLRRSGEHRDEVRVVRQRRLTVRSSFLRSRSPSSSPQKRSYEKRKRDKDAFGFFL